MEKGSPKAALSFDRTVQELPDQCGFFFVQLFAGGDAHQQREYIITNLNVHRVIWIWIRSGSGQPAQYFRS